MIYILDSSAMIAHLRREPGWEVVLEILLDKGNPCFAHAINLCEVYYDFYRSGGLPEATEAIEILDRSRVIRRTDMSPEFCQAVSILKATRRRISLADCFAVTLAQTVGGTLLTSDHHELDPLAAAGICSIAFIR